MNYSTFFLCTLLFITITVPVAIIIFDFFDVRFEVYGSYLFWFIALALFNALLPYQSRNIFEEEDDDIMVNNTKTNGVSDRINSVISTIKSSPIINNITSKIPGLSASKDASKDASIQKPKKPEKPYDKESRMDLAVMNNSLLPFFTTKKFASEHLNFSDHDFSKKPMTRLQLAMLNNSLLPFITTKKFANKHLAFTDETADPNYKLSENKLDATKRGVLTAFV